MNMKNIHHLLLAFFSFAFTVCSFAQVNTAIVDNDGNVKSTVNKGHYFRIDASISYDTDNYTDYQLKVILPEGVEWSSAVSADEDIILINSSLITNPSPGMYVIPFSPVQNGKKSVNFFLNSLLNNVVQNCTTTVTSTLEFELSAKLISSGQRVVIEQDISELTTPKASQLSGDVSLSFTHNQEKNNGGSNEGNYPYYVDVSIRSVRSLNEKPSITLAYPTAKLTYINAVLFNSDNPFHKGVIESPSITLNNGVFTIDENNSLLYNNSSNDVIRFYFNVTTSTTSIEPGEVVLKAEGATFINCGGDTVSVGTKTRSSTLSMAITPTNAILYPSIEHLNKPFDFCNQHCDFDINDPSASFHFETNAMYTTFGSTPSRVKILNPTGVAKISALKFDLSQYSTPPEIHYLTSTNSQEQQATISNLDNKATFGEDNPTVIFISNYVAPNSYTVAKDFEITYLTLLSNLTPLPNDQKIFTVSYEDTDAEKNYKSEPIKNNNSCEAGLSFQDRYESPEGGVFSNAVVSYSPGSYHTIQLKISPEDLKYKATYNIVDLTYQLNENMIFEPDFDGVLVSETGVIGSYQLKKKNSNTNKTYYKNIQITKAADGRTLTINATLNNTIDCEIPKALYILVPVYVKANAVASNSGYEAILNTNGNNFSDEDINKWKVDRSDYDKVSASLSVLCPSDKQEFSDYTAGQEVVVQYVISNENQNSISNIKLTIPVIQNGTFSGGANGVKIVSKINPNVELSSQFFPVPLNLSPQTSQIIAETNSYVLAGNNKLLVEVKYTLNENAAVGTIENTISFKLNKYNSIGGVEREEVSSSNLGKIEIVEQSLCIPKPPCENCVTSLAPLVGHEYLLGAWVKESYNTVLKAKAPLPDSYKNVGIQVTFNDELISELPLFVPTGPIIDGWQRIEASFVVPGDAYNIAIELVNNGDNDAFFDDIRIHPFRSNMKSYVYDPATQRLTAVLDENNYATLYEYDDEGILVRVKKETERGIYTIQETRNNQSKIK